jgi:uncharacterized protein DUF6093
VTLQDAIEAELPFLRSEAEARMVDTWAIGTDLGWTFNGTEDVQTVTPLFTTKGRLKATQNVVRESEAGGRTVVETRRALHIPVDSASVPAGAVAQCTAVHLTSDPTMLNIIVRLSGPAPGSQTTARRLEVTEILT